MAAEKDELTGVETTGHEWDGLKELNNPLPKWWLYVLYATIVASIVYSVFVPPIPGVEGILPTARNQVADDIAVAREAQAMHLEQIAALDLQQIRDDMATDAQLREFVQSGGSSVFAENCAPCHGQGGAGVPGYPALVDDAWIWGGSLQEIHDTIAHGVRADDPDTRWSEMLAFGRDGILNSQEIADVAQYVLSLSGQDNDAEMAAAGEQIFLDNCAACHGENGGGDPMQGAPALNDRIWLYAGTAEQIEAQIQNPQHGVMPAWSGRLDDTTIKMLAVYVHTLGVGE